MTVEEHGLQTLFSQDKLAQSLHEEQLQEQIQSSTQIQDPCDLCMEFVWAGEQEEARQAVMDYESIVFGKRVVTRLCSPCFADIMDIDTERAEGKL